MPTIEEQVAGLGKRVDKMDTELKEHFDDQQRFISGALAGLEKRLGEKLGDQIADLAAKLVGITSKLDSLLKRRP